MHIRVHVRPVFQRTVSLKITQVPAPLSNFPPLLHALSPLNYSLVPSIFSQGPIYWTNCEGPCLSPQCHLASQSLCSTHKALGSIPRAT